MWRIVVLVALFLLMLGLKLGQVDVLAGEVDPATLASIGFIALFAFGIGELGTLIGLPRVTGYIVTGVLLGPSVTDILSGTVVEEMQVFNTLALGMIAATAGLELDIKAIRRVAGTLTYTVLLKIVLLLVMVGGTFVGIEMLFAPFGFENANAMWAFALIFAVLGIGTSPAIALAVINDTKAKGRFADLVLAIAVAKDLVVVVCLAIALAIAKALLSPDGGFDPAALGHVAWEIGGSLVLGALVGGVAYLYLRFVREEMLLFVVALILLVAQLTQFLHLELLLVFIVAGFVIRNFTKFEHDLLHPLEVVALPVFVVFFTTAGAAIDLEASLRVLPVALALFTARLAAYWVASRFGSGWGGESPAVKSNAWLAYIPQAGVTLGLVLLAGKALPEYATAISSLGMALVALNLLVGPITLGVALKRGGETGEPVEAVEEAPADEVEAPAEVVVSKPESSEPETQEAPAVPWADIEQHAGEAGPRLTSLMRSIEELLADIRAEMLVDIDASAQRATQMLADGAPGAGQLRETPCPWTQTDAEWTARVREWLNRLDAVFDGAPRIVRVALDPACLRGGETAMARVRGLLRRAVLRLRPHSSWRARRVPMRTLVLISLQGRTLDAMMALLDARARALSFHLEAVGRVVDAGISAQEGVELIANRVAQAKLATELDLRHVLISGGHEAARWAATADTPAVPLRALGFGSVEPRQTEAREVLLSRPARWESVLSAQEETVFTHALLAGLHTRLSDAVTRRLSSPLEDARKALVEHTTGVAERLDAVLEGLGDAPPSLERLRELQELAADAYGPKTRRAIRRGTARFRLQALPGHLRQEMLALVEEAPDRVVGVDATTPPSEAVSPRAVVTKEIRLHHIMERRLSETFLVRVVRLHATALEVVAEAPQRLAENAHVAAYAFGLALSGQVESPAEWHPLVRDSVARASARVRELATELDNGMRDTAQRAEQGLTESLKAIRQEADFGTSLGSGARMGRSRLFQLAGRATLRVRGLRTRARVAALRAWHAIRDLRHRRELLNLRLRSGMVQLDPAAMAGYLEKHLPDPANLSVPPLYARLYSLMPVDDRRFFVGRDQAMTTLRTVYAAWRSGGRRSMLILGAEGTGKSSLLNMFRMDVDARRMVRLDPRFANREEGVVAAMAAELECEPTSDAVQIALRGDNTVVVMDGLQRWFEPTPRGVEQLLEMRKLLVGSPPSVLWVVVSGEGAFAQLDQLADLSPIFSDRIQLNPFDGSEVREMIEVRDRLSGVSLTHAEGRWKLRWPPYQRQARLATAYFDDLAGASSGNPRRVLHMHLLHLRFKGNDAIAGEPFTQGIPFLGQLPELALVALTELVRLGTMSPVALAQDLGIDDVDVAAQVELLRFAGLVERGSSDLIRIPVHLRGPLTMELRTMERLGGGS